LKTAETDATKRALATFGNPFGLALYDSEQSGVRQRGRGNH
jgi:recombination DNA repair RAD52 pathway protein